MNLFYIDETRQAPFSILGGFIISEADYIDLCKNLVNLKAKYGLKAHDPIKFSPKKEKGYEAQTKIGDQNYFKVETLNLISESPITIISSVIRDERKHDKKNRAHHHKLGLEFLAQRLQKELETKEGKGRMIVDFPSEEIAPDLMRYYAHLKVEGSTRKFHTIFRNLAETIYYSHCFCCNGLQVADFIVGSLGNFFKTKDDRFIRIISPKFRRNSIHLRGYGLALHPNDWPFWEIYLKKI